MVASSVHKKMSLPPRHIRARLRSVQEESMLMRARAQDPEEAYQLESLNLVDDFVEQACISH